MEGSGKVTLKLVDVEDNEIEFVYPCAATMREGEGGLIIVSPNRIPSPGEPGPMFINPEFFPLVYMVQGE